MANDLELKEKVLKDANELIDAHQVYLMFDIFNGLDNELKRAFVSMLDKWIDKNKFRK